MPRLKLRSENQRALRKLFRRIGQFEELEARIALTITPLDGRPFVDVGPSDNVALDQPRVTTQLINSQDQILGPSIFSSWLLDTGANTILTFQAAVEEMNQFPPTYETEGKFNEVGVGGFQLYDISKPYQFDYAGNSGIRNTLMDTRLISDPTRDLSIFGPWGIVGMKGMEDKVTSFDFSVWTDFSLELFMRTEFGDTLPSYNGPRYSISVDDRIKFFPDEHVVSGPNPPVWSHLPFLSAELVSSGHRSTGNFLFDTGAQVSIMSYRMAFELGLDTNGDGVLSQTDANFARLETISGIGGSVDVPVFLVDEVHVPTDQGADLVWTDLQWLVLDIVDGIDAIFGFDNSTSGWLEAFATDGQSGFIMQEYLDFRNWSTTGQGKIYFDLNPDFFSYVDPNGPGAIVFESGGSTTVREGAETDTYTLRLSTQPTASVQVDLSPTSVQAYAVDLAHPANHFLIFTPENWNIPQEVLVTADNDSTEESFHRSYIRHIASSSDPNYDHVGMPRVVVNITDDDYPGVMIIRTDGATEVTEGGASDTYQLVLTKQPTKDVFIVFQNLANQVTLAAQATGLSFVQFTPENWNVPQSVVVTAVDDDFDEGPHIGYISHRIATEDPGYQDAFVQQEYALITDNDRTAIATVAGGSVFYNNSAFDKANDQSAIATDKVPYRAGSGVAAFSNYTNYVQGINGVIVDIKDMAGTPTLADFSFKVGNSQTPATWSTAPSPSSMTIFAGAGVGGSDRIIFTWPDKSIVNKWLEVTTLVTAATGLNAPDVMYWGNQVAEVGNEVGSTAVDVADTLLVSLNPTGFIPAAVTNRYDLNHDQAVDSADYILSQLAQTGFVSLVLLNLSGSNRGSGGSSKEPTVGDVQASPNISVATELSIGSLGLTLDPAWFAGLVTTNNNGQSRGWSSSWQGTDEGTLDSFGLASPPILPAASELASARQLSTLNELAVASIVENEASQIQKQELDFVNHVCLQLLQSGSGLPADQALGSMDSNSPEVEGSDINQISANALVEEVISVIEQLMPGDEWFANRRPK
ncbi:MAG: retropepsin-like domain-containing protein [Planctomycetales bacterium]|nr:retropepsin-like domain-containing protein [Planctomycetales bacterium]